MDILISIVLAIVFSVFSTVVTAQILATHYMAKLARSLDGAIEKVKIINKENKRKWLVLDI